MQKQKNTDSVNEKNRQLTDRIEMLSEKVRNDEKSGGSERKIVKDEIRRQKEREENKLQTKIGKETDVEIKDMLLTEMIKIVEEAGEILLSASHIEEAVEEKSGHANFVTAYDKKVQDFLFSKLKEVLPEAVFIGEEEEEHQALPEGYAFIIDPIDGTTNFMKGYHVSSISVGLLKAGQPEIGVVYNPYLHEVFYAGKGMGAFCNGRPIKASGHGLSDGIILFGTAPYNEELAGKSFDWAYSLFIRSMDIRRSGSAAIDLCNIACGRAELYFELLLSPWDYAAGALIVTEAGGHICTPNGGKLLFDEKCGVVAAGEKAMRDFEELLQENIL